jgi:hypothetical protein
MLHRLAANISMNLVVAMSTSLQMVPLESPVTLQKRLHAAQMQSCWDHLLRALIKPLGAVGIGVLRRIIRKFRAVHAFMLVRLVRCKKFFSGRHILLTEQ